MAWSYCGAATVRADTSKWHSYTQHSDFHFVPLSVETYGRLGRPFMQLLDQLSEEAATHSEGTLSGVFVSSVLQEIGVALCRWHGRLECAVTEFFARATGSCFV
jgi:hypothetical protein